MYGSAKMMDTKSRLILHNTPTEKIEEGITVISRGEGVRVYDQDDKSYIDLVAGVTRPVHLGYGREDLARAIYDQACRLAYFTPMGFANVPALKLADVLADITPGRINRFLFECDGSEAVESAMKIAKHYHHYNGERGRFKVISRKGAYHGVNGIGIRALGTVIPMRQVMEPIAPGGIFVESPYCYRCPYYLTYPACDMECVKQIEALIQFEGPELISAFIGEPIQQAFGACAPPKEYWPLVRNICNKYGIMMIIDEVICGFGRTGKMFGVEHFDVQPDMITMAKGITSGYVPLGAVGCTDQLVERIHTFSHLHTYGNHPVPCAAGIKTIELIKQEGLVERSREMGKYFLEHLKPLEHHPIVGEVRGVGLWTAIDFTIDKKTRAPLPSSMLADICDRSKCMGLIIKPAPHGQALEFAPPLIIQKEEIDEAVKILDECITAVSRDL